MKEQGRYINLETNENGDLILTPTQELLEEWYTDDYIYDLPDIYRMTELFEDYLGNGWYVIPEGYLGLTSCFGITNDATYDDDDDFQVYGNIWTDWEYYQIRSWVEDLIYKGKAILYKVK